MPGNQPPEAAQQPDGGGTRAIDWDVVYDEHSPRIRRIIERRAGTSVADDLLQETFERALRGEGRFNVERPMAPWLNTIAFHLTSDLRRQRLSSGEVLVEEEPEVLGPDLAEEAYLASLRRMGIREAFASLNHRHRRVLQLVAIEGMTNEEVAEFEHMTTEAVKSVLARARVNFRASYSAFVERMGMLAGVGALGPVVMRLRARLQRFADLAANHAGAITVAAVTTAVVGIATYPATQSSATRAVERQHARASVPGEEDALLDVVVALDPERGVAVDVAATVNETATKDTPGSPESHVEVTTEAEITNDGARSTTGVTNSTDTEAVNTRTYAGVTTDCTAGTMGWATCRAIDVLAEAS